MARLTREQLLEAATKLPTETVHVEELGGDVVLTTLSANERLDWERAAWPEGAVDVKEYWAGLVARTLVGEDGKPLLSTEEVGNFARPTIEKLNAVASRLNGIGVQAVADTEGKSEGTSVSDQPSSSHGDSDTPTPA